MSVQTATRSDSRKVASKQAADKAAIRPFRLDVPEAELTELRRRINATRWHERETVTDHSRGVPLPTMQSLARLTGASFAT